MELDTPDIQCLVTEGHDLPINLCGDLQTVGEGFL